MFLVAGIAGCVHIVPADQRFINDDAVLSPPIIAEPLYACSPSVSVHGFIPGAKIEIYSNGIKVGEGEGTHPSGQRFNVEPALVEGEDITATQTFNGVTSLPSEAVKVRSHLEDYPHGLPKPIINPVPLYNCGRAVGVKRIVPGANLSVFARPATSAAPGATVGRVKGSAASAGVLINPPFVETELVTAQYQICDDVSPFSDREIVKPAPASLSAPAIDRPRVGMDNVVARSSVHGVFVDIYSGSDRVGGGTVCCDAARLRINPRAGEGDRYRANQRLCGEPGPWSPDAPVIPCSELPAPVIRQPVSGDDTIHVTSFVPGSRITIFVGDVAVGGEEIGDGGGGEIRLIRPLGYGEVVHVVQSLGDCVSRWMYEVETGCAEPTRWIPDPSGGMYDVGRMDYNLLPVSISEDTGSLLVRIAGSVRYPLVPGTTDLIRRPEKLPLVLLMPGDYEPNSHSASSCVNPYDPTLTEVMHHQGYDYVLDDLARGGFIVVSINANDIGCHPDIIKDDRVRMKKELLFHHLRKWKLWNDPALPDPVFGGRFHDRVDLGRVGLIGHSMGGEAVVVAAQESSIPAITIGAVVAAAPTSWTDLSGVLLEDIPLLVITGDNDWSNEFGTPKIYGRAQRFASDDWFKSKVIIKKGIHDYFIETITEGLNPPNPIEISRADQEAAMRVFSRAFFELALRAREDLRPVFTGRARVSGLEEDTPLRRFEFSHSAARDAVCQ